ncbi:unnamed protein product [Diabrotica balteata]|uniref:Uncharacterized protein n=1 Tax=Diabrotica balteata TaxID=107213 RepID=A0A9N9SZT7_DIABA|nr:unnamed protein product [Diabrotica balteata]
MTEVSIKIEEQSRELSEIHREQREYREEIRQLRQENVTLREENTKLKQVVFQIEERLESLENGKRRKNIVIQGMNINKNVLETLKQEINNFIQVELAVDVQIEKVVKLGEKVCLVELEKEVDKRKVMRNKSKLRNRRKCYNVTIDIN